MRLAVQQPGADPLGDDAGVAGLAERVFALTEERVGFGEVEEDLRFELPVTGVAGDGQGLLVVAERRVGLSQPALDGG